MKTESLKSEEQKKNGEAARQLKPSGKGVSRQAAGVGQQKMQNIADDSRLVSRQGVFQRMADSKAVVQKVNDGFYNVDKTDPAYKIPKAKIKLLKAFKDKHIGDTKGDAEDTWRKRNTDGNMPAAMRNGTLANTSSSETKWIDAIDASNDEAAELGWDGNIRVTLDVWNTTGSLVAPIAAANAVQSAGANRTVGGTMTGDGEIKVDHVGN